MDEPALLRQAADEMRAVVSALRDAGGGPLHHAVRLASNPATWQGPFAQNFTMALRHHDAGLQRAADAMTAVATRWETIATERAAAVTMGPTLPATE